MSELPKGWEDIELRDLVGLAHTGLVRSAKDQSDEFEFPYLKMNNLSISGRFLLDEMTKVNATPPEVGKFTLERGDFLFNTRNSVELVGKCGVYQGSVHDQILFNNNLLKIKFLIVLPEIIAYWFNSALGKKQLSEITSATTSVAAIYQKALMTRRVPVPPLAEQKRIVEKLDEVLAQVDTIKARLDGIPELLKRFRQSVLASAVSGKLTEEWHGDSEAPKPIAIAEEFINIPSSWGINSLESLITQNRKICYGVVQPGDLIDGGKPLIRVCDINNGVVDYSNLRTISNEVDAQYHRSKVQKSDLLVTIVGAIGRVAVISEDIEANIARAVARISPNVDIVEPKYLLIWLSCPKLQWWLNNSSREVARKTLNLSELKKANVALPTIEEQKEIVRLVDQYFAFADTIEAQVKKAQVRVNNLTQSILAKAFRGELVAQDPNDEPADKLLERIAEARKEAEALAKAAKKAEAAKKRAAKKAAENS